MNIFYNRQS